MYRFRFSVNFILPQLPPAYEINGQTEHKCCGQVATSNQSWPYIAYHFKVIFNDDGSRIVAQNWKNIVWQEEERTPSDLFQDRTRPFTLIFRFDRDTIRVFVDDTDCTSDYVFEYQLPLERIRTVEVWDDVEYVEEVTFRFGNVSGKLMTSDVVYNKFNIFRTVRMTRKPTFIGSKHLSLLTWENKHRHCLLKLNKFQSQLLGSG